MKILKQVILRTVAGESMLVPVGNTVLEYNGLFLLTESGKLLWQAITDGKEKQDLANVLIAEYGIDEKMAIEDVELFLSKLREFGIVE